MEILSVTLRNFKAHADRHIVFQAGTNAICGENGAGKTSVLEAIAWTLFNHRGNYKVEDFIRNGNGSAQARIAFISNRDGRTYEVERCTHRGYTLFDPQLGQRLDYHNIEQEVLPWLRQHLGVAPGTDLARLFSNTIGVPQGTFTADFLKTPEDRKKVFDTILKVEEYKQVNRETLGLERYARGQVETLEEAIARYDNELQALEPIQARVTQVREELAAGEAQLQQWTTELATVRQQRDVLRAKAEQIQVLHAQQQQVLGQMEAKRQAIAFLTDAVQDTQTKIQQCEASRPDYDAYQALQQTLQTLEQRLQQRAPLQQQRDAVQGQITTQSTQMAKLEAQLAQLDRYQLELDTLRPMVVQQAEWETKQANGAIALQQVNTTKLEAQALTQQITEMKRQHAHLREQIEHLATLAEVVAQLPDLEQQRDRLQAQLSRIEAAQQFETELRQLVQSGKTKRDRHQNQVSEARTILEQMQAAMPLLSSESVTTALAAVQAGVDLNTELLDALHTILDDLRQQTDANHLKRIQKDLLAQIKAAHQAEAAYATLAQKQADLDTLVAQLSERQEALESLQPTLAQEATLQAQQQQCQDALAQLNNPKGRVQLLEAELAQRNDLHHQLTQAKTEVSTLTQHLQDLDQQLQEFVSLEAESNQTRTQLKQHQTGYLTYLQNQEAIAQLPQQQEQLQSASDAFAALEAEAAQQQATLAEMTATFDPKVLTDLDTQHNQIQRQADQLSGSLPPKRTLLAELETQIEKLQAIVQQRKEAHNTLKRRQKTLRFIKFARKAYRDAGPRITERYLHRISREADRLFRELINRPSVALEWTRDYEILVQENQHTRRFVNLSGGEQMCAALAVRLALLRVLADIDVAFFDEPTTNMDRQRRQSLAEAIANIKTFQQIFVISHDDTFESVTENVIMLSRE